MKRALPFIAAFITAAAVFAAKPPASFAEVMQCDKGAFNRFFHAMLDHGIYLAPSAFEAGFVSAAHSDADIYDTISAAREVFTLMKNK